MSDEENAKVISFATRRVVEEAAKEPEAEEVKLPAYDEDSFKVATDFLEAVQEGRYKSAFVVGWDEESKSFFSDMVLPKDDHPDLSASKLLAYLECVKLELLSIIKNQIITLVEDDSDE